MQTDSDYRINLIAELISDLKDKNHRIKSKEMAVEIIKLVDNIAGIEYKYKIDYHKKDYKVFMGKV